VQKFYTPFQGKPAALNLFTKLAQYPIVPPSVYKPSAKELRFKRLYLLVFEYATASEIVHKVSRLGRFLHQLTWNHELCHQAALHEFGSRETLETFKRCLVVETRAKAEDVPELNENLLVEKVDFLRKVIFFLATVRQCLGCEKIFLEPDVGA